MRLSRDRRRIYTAGQYTLLIINLTAIATTKVPELFRPTQGFWFMVTDARTDFAMLTGIIFLLIVGAGKVSFDWKLSTRKRSS